MVGKRYISLFGVLAMGMAVTLASCSSKDSTSSTGTTSAASSAAPSTTKATGGSSTTAGSTGSSTAGTAATGANTIDITVSDTKGVTGPMTMTVKPDTAKAGKVTFTVKNTGTVEHEVVVLALSGGETYDGLKTDTASTVSESTSKGESGEIAPGESKTFDVNLDAGKYALVCNIEQHYAMGMRAPFTVS